MKKYAILAIAVVLVVLFAAVSVDAFSLKFFKPAIKLAKVTPTSTSKAPAHDTGQCTGQGYGDATQGPGFCGWSNCGFCSNDGDCFLSQVYRECSSVYTYGGEGTGPQETPECANGQKYGMSCGCTSNKCQWTKVLSAQNQGQGQGSQGAGQGNGQSSQGQQGQGMGKSQSQNQGEGGSFQCLNIPEEKRCIDSEGIHQYCTGADGCYTRLNYNCGAGENDIQKCVAGAVAAMCLASC